MASHCKNAMRAVWFIVLAVMISCKEKRPLKTPPATAIPAKDTLVKNTWNYDQFKKMINNYRLQWRAACLQANDSTRMKVLQAAANHLTQWIAGDFYNYWKGTPWDFNGTTTTPGGGSIACGYFVTGILKDAGFPLNRTRLATCASLTMMKTLTSSKEIRNLSLWGFDDFTDTIKKRGAGVYIVGLDFHTGFIVHDGKESWFIHSNYINQSGVTKEKMDQSIALRSSKTRYITSLTASEKFLRTWLLHQN